jgi:hypothetical protein
VEGNLICDAQTISSEPTSSFFSYALAQNFPNPFNTSTKISYTVGSDGLVQIYILNTLGQVVKTITKENHQAGSYEVYWHALDEFGNSVAPGIYLVVMRATGFIQTRKIILIK